MTAHEASEDTGHSTNRRTVLKGAAWSMPVIAATVATPLAAATDPDPCDPPVLPIQGSQWHLSTYQTADPIDPKYALEFKTDGAYTFVRNYQDVASDAVGNGWVKARGSLGILSAGATYSFTYNLRAIYATQEGSSIPDPNHLNSFASSVQGGLTGLAGVPLAVATATHSTRPDQIPGDQAPMGPQQAGLFVGLNDVAWVTYTSSFTVPADYTGEELFFEWYFIHANRSARDYKLNPADGGVPHHNKTANDDIDITLPVFVGVVGCL